MHCAGSAGNSEAGLHASSMLDDAKQALFEAMYILPPNQHAEQGNSNPIRVPRAVTTI